MRPWLVKYPDLTGTWYATSMPGEWAPFTSVVSLEHRFSGVRVKLIRCESRGLSLTTTLARAPTEVPRLYVVYDSRAITDNQRVDHGEDHSGFLYVDLTGEDEDKKSWIMSGEYWTNKRRDPKKDTTRGTWGKIEMKWIRRRLPSENVEALDATDSQFLKKHSDTSFAAK